jgi:amino acid adenylation domain-containing protein
MQNAYGLQPEDRVLQKTPFSFDVSVWEFFWPLLTGARLILAIPDGHRDSTYLRDIIQHEGITTLHFVPSMLHSFLHEPEVEACGSVLRRVFSSGEALSSALQARFFARLPTVDLHNLYGPTEAAVDVTAWACQLEDPSATVPIGRPITNIQIHILDSDDQLVPIGVSGELHIAGVGLARGYHLRPALTAEKFIPNPLRPAAGGRIYKTGDLARYRSDGAIEYLGRLDHQVKIRGFRIERGEIEAALTTHPNIREAVVVPWRDQSQAQRLVAYLVSTTTDAPTTTELIAWLKRTLPDYMLPARFIIMNALPLTSSGKIDRRALPSPGSQRPHLEDIFVSPTTPLEVELASIWSQVLEVTPVGIHDSFFELGGDSIRAIQVLAQAQQQGIHFTLQQLFTGQTIHSLIHQFGQNRKPVPQSEDLTVPFCLIAPEDRRRLPAGLEDAYPLTSLQMGMFYHNETNPTSAIFHDIFTFRIQYPFHHERLQLAVDRFVERHAPMRTSFDLGSFTEPLQLVHPSARLLLAVEDLQHLDSTAQTKTLEAWIADEKRRPFDPTQAPLLRLLVHRYGTDEFQLIVSFHHVILDGWSLAVMLTEILQDYSALFGVFNSSLTAPAIPYRAYVASERAALAAEDSRQFWIEKLHDPDIHLLPRWPESYRAGGTEQMRSSEIPIPSKIFAGLKALALNAKVPLKSVLLAAHHRVMNALHGRPDVISGIITNGRPEEIDGERMVGLFLNTVPVRLRLDGGTWFELVQQVFLAELELIPHRRFPLADIQQALGGQMLFETAFDFVHFHVYRNLDGYKDMGFMEGHYFEANSFVLFTTFMMDVTSTQLQMHIDYDPAQLCAEQIKPICDYYVNTLSSMASQPHARYDTFSPLTHQERHQQLLVWNNTTRDYLTDKGLHGLFEEQVIRTPDAVALIDGIHSLSYAHLNQRANRLAHNLVAKGVGPDVPVAVCMARTADMLLALLAILKAGGAYVPLDPTYPASWLATVLEEMKAPVLLTQRQWVSQLPAESLQVLLLDESTPFPSERELLSNPPTKIHAEHLVYVLFTSGSTGQPKGVAITHRSAVSLISWGQEQFLPEELEGVLASTSTCFDLSVFEIFLPLSFGGTVILAENALAIPTLPAASQITLLNSVPSVVHELLHDQRLPSSIQVVNLAGEPLRTSLVQQLHAEPGIRKVYDLYGPSETTTYSTMALRQADGPETIGQPVTDEQIYLVGLNQQLVPVGVAGELMIGGAGLARGYYGRPGLTAEKFIPNDLAPHPGTRLYRTGDRGRYLPDGQIEYLGRFDHQVKVRGFRIELGEIENILFQHPAVQEAAVLCRENTSGEKQLVAYVVSGAKEPLSPANLRAFLQQKLPEYMIPTAFLVLDAIPLTPNGKIDRRALPPPDKAPEKLETTFVPPQTLEEEILADIWATTMNIPRVGIYDNFFSLGGHSLLATQIISKIRGAFFIDLSIRALFDHPTVADLAQQLTEIWHSVSQQEPTTVSPRTTQKSFPLSYIQKRFWILDELCKGYALSRAFQLRGSLNEQAIRHSFQDMVDRHEILRTTFSFFGGQPQQVIAPTVTLDIPIIDLHDLDDETRESEGSRLLLEEEAQPFDLAQGPLLRVKLLRFDSTNYFIIITLHQAICDCFAIEVLFRELSTLYRSYCEGRTPSLPALLLQYADFTLWQRQHLESPAGARELDYWQKILEDLPPPLPLSTDYPRGSVQTFRSNQVQARLSQEFTHKISLLKKRTGSTFFMILLGVINLFLFRVTGMTDFVIGSPVAGRQRPEFEPLIGSFLNNLVLRTRFSKDQTAGTYPTIPNPLEHGCFLL